MDDRPKHATMKIPAQTKNTYVNRKNYSIF